MTNALQLLSRGVRQLKTFVHHLRSPADVLRAAWLMASWHLLKRRRGSSAPEGAWKIDLKGSGRPFYVRPGTSDFEVMRCMFLADQYASMNGRLEPDAVIVDLGANIGTSIRLWQQLCPKARIVAVEPDADNIGMIRKNLLPNFAGDIDIIPAGAASVSGKGVMSDQGEAWGLRVEQVANAAPGDKTIQLMTVPEILKAAGLEGQRINLFKCDIEGAEAQLFGDPRASVWLMQVEYLSIELHDGYTLPRFENDLNSAGMTYEMIELKDNGQLVEATMLLRPIPRASADIS